MQENGGGLIYVILKYLHMCKIIILGTHITAILPTFIY